MASAKTETSVKIWLLICAAMVFVMALLGAITRLTESGLSITDWNPIMGAIPPLNDGDWEKAFASYREIPQYKVLHSYMTLDQFKGIFFWEWLHRFWGRLIGLVFALPYLWFLARRNLGPSLKKWLGLILALIGLQGFIGWFMVKSGLEVRTSVSPYRLALHLGLALLIYAIMIWTALPLKPAALKETTVAQAVKRHGWIALLLLAITMIWGAFTAGLHAGEAYNTWPLMEGEILPSASFTLNPIWVNAFENLALVQFIHRWLGPLTTLVILAWVARLWSAAPRRDGRRRAALLALMGCCQVALGLSTLLSNVNRVLATLHQAGAITLLTLLLINLKSLRVTPTGRTAL